MEFLTVKMALMIANIILLIFYVHPVVATSTVRTSTAGASSADSTTTTMDLMSTMETTTRVSTESPSTTDGTSSTVTESGTPVTTSETLVTMSMSSSSPETAPPSTPMATMSSTTIVTSGTTPINTMSPMETTMTTNDTSPTMASAGPVLGQAEIIAIGVGGGVLLLVLAIIAAFCIYKKCSSGHCTGNRTLSKFDEDDTPARMSMHRPESSAMNADGDLDFLTFTGKRIEVDGIVNPTYDTTAIIDETPSNNHGGEEKVDATDDGRSSTMPSNARLIQNADEGKDGGSADGERDTEGVVDASETGEDVTSDPPPAAITEGDMRPMSGVSYKSGDIDLALEVLDVGTV